MRPISHFVLYKGLSSFFLTFTIDISCVEILRSIQEAPTIIEWKNVVLEEMKALKKKYLVTCSISK